MLYQYLLFKNKKEMKKKETHKPALLAQKKQKKNEAYLGFQNICLFILPFFLLMLIHPMTAHACATKIKKQIINTKDVSLPFVIDTVKIELSNVVDMSVNIFPYIETNSKFVKKVKPFLYKFQSTNWNEVHHSFPFTVSPVFVETLVKKANLSKLKQILEIRGGSMFGSSYLASQAFNFLRAKIAGYINKKVEDSSSSRSSTSTVSHPRFKISIDAKTPLAILVLGIIGFFFRNETQQKTGEIGEIVLKKKKKKYSITEYLNDVLLWCINNPLLVIGILGILISVIPITKYLTLQFRKTEVGSKLLEFLERQNEFAKQVITDRVQDIKTLTTQLLKQASGVNNDLADRLRKEELKTTNAFSKNDSLQKLIQEQTMLLNKCEMKKNLLQKEMKEQSIYLLNENSRATNQKLQIKNAQSSLSDFLTQNPNVCSGLGKEKLLDYVDKKVFPEITNTLTSGIVVDTNDPLSVNSAYKLDDARKYAKSIMKEVIEYKTPEFVFDSSKTEVREVREVREETKSYNQYQATGFEKEKVVLEKNQESTKDQTKDQKAEHNYLDYQREKALELNNLFGARDKKLTQVFKRCVAKNKNNPKLNLDCKEYEFENLYDFSTIPDLE
jgi:hypothetical protein